MYLPKQESTMVSFYTIKGFTYERDNEYELIGEKDNHCQNKPESCSFSPSNTHSILNSSILLPWTS